MDNNFNKKFLSFCTLLGIANFILSIINDREVVPKELFQTYFIVTIFCAISCLIFFLINIKKGFISLNLDLFFGMVMSWGIYLQFLIPDGYLNTVILLFVYSLFYNISLKKFISLTTFFTLMTVLAIWISKSIDMKTEDLVLKSKENASHTTIIMAIFVNITYYFKTKTQEKIQKIESKWIDLGSQSSIFIHDLKNMVFPLTNHSNFLLKKKDQLPEFAQDVNKEMNESIKAMSEYIQEFNQSFSFKNEKTSIKVQDLVDTSKKMYKNKIGKTNISVSQSSEWIADSHIVKSILNNLLINSGDAFAEKQIIDPKIAISFSKNQLIYTDNAGGLPVEKLKDIKDDVYFSTKKAGSGIGIFTIKKYVGLLKGKVSFDNKNNGIYVVIDLN